MIMAKQWGSSRIGQHGHQKPFFPENRYRETQNMSGLNLHNYQGHYNRSMLFRAREELSLHIEHMQDTAIWCRIKRKTDVNVHGDRTSYFQDGFGESSTAFSHAELHENMEQECDQTDFDLEPQDSILGSSNMKPAQTITSAAEAELVFDLTEHDADNSNSSSDCVVVEDKKHVSSVDKNLDLESDGLEIIEDETEPGVIVIDDLSSKVKVEKPWNEKQELDNKNIGHYSGFVNGNIHAKDGRNTNFKCDCCEFVCDTSAIAQQHLNKAVHFAASEYSIDKEGNMTLKNRMSLQNIKAKFKTVIVICPNCLKVFPDIHSCSTHCNFQHQKENNGRKDVYGLVHVIQEEVCNNNVHEFKCQRCSKCFKSRSAVIQHIMDLHHYPYTDGNNYDKIFFCLHCKTSFNSFEKVIYHQDSGHGKLSKDGELQLAVFHYKSVESHTLLLGTSTPLGANKRKHDGRTTEIEPRKKIACTSTNENATTTSNDSSHITKGKLSSLEVDNHTIRNSTDNTLDSLSEQNAEDEEDTAQDCLLSEVFKCDYCTKILKDKSEMYLHLVEKYHSSASTVSVDHQGNIAYLKSTKTISYEGANFKTVVAICNIDTCRLLFETPFLCEDHSIRCHHGKGGYYHLADIKARKPIKLSLSVNICSVCKQRFQTAKQLNDHCSQFIHFPFQKRNDCNVSILCCYCSKTFFSYTVACNHVKKHTALAKNDQLDMVILYVSKSARMVSVPPYELTKQGEIKSIKSKISNLYEMKKTCGKAGRSHISKQIRNVKQLL